jgi:hypothetical protein
MNFSGCFKILLYGIVGIIVVSLLYDVIKIIIPFAGWIIGGAVVLFLLKLLFSGGNSGTNSTDSGFFRTNSSFGTELKARMRYERNLGYRRDSEAVDKLFGSLRDRQ